MGDVGLLLSLPTDSIAVRVAVASLVAVVLGRAMLRSGLRVPRVRAAVAILPGLAIVLVALAYARNPALPSVWRSIDSSGALTIPVRDTYLSFVPMTMPLVLGLWGSVATTRLVVRWRRATRVHRSLTELADSGSPAPDGVVVLVERLAAALRLTPPAVVVVPALSGGAAIAGVRRPVLLVDAALLESLDRSELEGVLAHELAHVQRRDNLAAALLGVLRDILFFVPGGAWSLRLLLREREHAADTAAVDVTGRPGALASGLLKVIEAASGRGAVACASLLNEGTLVQRVQILCDERPPATRVRRFAEVGIGAVTLAGAVLAAVALPTLAAGVDRERDALGVLVSDVAARTDAPLIGRAAVFRAYDATGGVTTSPATVPEDQPASAALLELDDPEAVGPMALRACALERSSCNPGRVDARLSLSPQPIVRVDAALVDQWRLDPLVRSDSQEVGVFWFQRLPGDA